jgi:Trypsin-like peptidase domain
VTVREIISMLIACSCLSPLAVAQKAFPRPSTTHPSAEVEHTQDFSEIVVPISSVKITPLLKLSMSRKLVPELGIDAGFGTGFCLDAACLYIVTNYHVAIGTQVGKIQKQKIVQRYLATGPDENGATPNYVPGLDVVAYAKKRDLAMFKLQHPLPHHHGLSFHLDELRVGQEVDIYGYPKGAINPFRKLRCFPAKFEAPTTSGLLAFDYESPTPMSVAGSSGGIVVDRETQEIVGILSESNETTAAAVPVQTLVEFVTKVQPFLAQRIFPATKQIPPASADIYPKFVPLRSDGLQHRPEEPYEVRVLRQKAQFLADSIRDFIAVETYAWGTEDREPDVEAVYEVRVIDGDQKYRSFPDGKKDLDEIALPHRSAWVNPADQWSKLPKLVGTDFRLKVHQAPDVVMNERRVKVFQYYATVEDNLCPFEPVESFGFFTISKTIAVACYGEVWTDENMNIVRMSERLDLSEKLRAFRGWEDYHTIVTYGWLKRTDETPLLVPWTIYAEGRDKKHIYWCRGNFTDYRVFSVRARLVTN